MRLIDADECPCKGCPSTTCYMNCDEYYEWLNKEVQPVKHGNWIKLHADTRGNAMEYECSACRTIIDLPYYERKCYYEYCPWCGVKMDGEVEE